MASTSSSTTLTASMTRVTARLSFQSASTLGTDSFEQDFIDTVFGTDPVPPYLLPGLRAYAHYVQNRLESLVDKHYNKRQHASMLASHDIDHSDRVLSLATQTLGVIKSVTTSDTRISEVVQQLSPTLKQDIAQHAVPASGVSEQHQERVHCHRFVFCTVALATMLFRVADSMPRAGLDIHISASHTWNVELTYRPMLSLLKGLSGIIVGGCCPSLPVDGISPIPKQLEVPNLSASSIISIGRMSIIWTDSLDQHLKYDETNRQVSIFKFPSFLLAACRPSSGSFLQWTVDRLSTKVESSTINASHPQIECLAAEIILSYRLIFGQNKSSRRRYRKHLRTRTSQDDCFDPLLDQLCNLTDSKLCQQQPGFAPLMQKIGSVLEPSNYPHLGERLSVIQEQVKKWRPRRFVDMYRDRREKDKYYAFWAVMIFGVIAVCIGIVQVLLSIAQLVLACYQLKATG